MPRSRVNPYGPEYEQLLLTAFAGLPYEFPLADHGQANLFKAKFYGYFRALRQENLRLDLIEMADSLTLSVRDHVLIIKLKSQMWDAIAIRQQLGLQDGFDTHGTAIGNELQVPDLLGSRLLKQLQLIRERKANAANIVPGFKSDN